MSNVGIWGEQVRDDPYSAYERLRKKAPVYRAASGMGVDIWLITRHEPARAALADPRLSTFPRHAPQRLLDLGIFTLTRADHGHLAFGRGIHYCLGAPLARLEGEVAIGTLLRRFLDLALACRPEELCWRGGPGVDLLNIIRGLEALPLRVAPVV